MSTSDQLTALLSTSARSRDNLIFEFSKLDSQLRKTKTDTRKWAASDHESAFDFALFPLKKQ